MRKLHQIARDGLGSASLGGLLGFDIEHSWFYASKQYQPLIKGNQITGLMPTQMLTVHADSSVVTIMRNIASGKKAGSYTATAKLVLRSHPLVFDANGRVKDVTFSKGIANPDENIVADNLSIPQVLSIDKHVMNEGGNIVSAIKMATSFADATKGAKAVMNALTQNMIDVTQPVLAVAPEFRYKPGPRHRGF